MESKYLTLQTIYELVKYDAQPASKALHPYEIIVRQNFPWDEVAKYLHELKSENFIRIIQQSPTLIFITELGFQFIVSARSKPGNFMYAA